MFMQLSTFISVLQHFWTANGAVEFELQLSLANERVVERIGRHQVFRKFVTLFSATNLQESILDVELVFSSLISPCWLYRRTTQAADRVS